MLKKILIPFVMLAVSMGACKKYDTCDCLKTSKGINDLWENYSVEENVERPITPQSSKKKAEAECYSYNSFIDGNGGTSEKIECELK